MRGCLDTGSRKYYLTLDSDLFKEVENIKNIIYKKEHDVTNYILKNLVFYFYLTVDIVKFTFDSFFVRISCKNRKLTCL